MKQLNFDPTKGKVDFDVIYRYNNPEALSFLNRPLGQRDLVPKTIASVTKAINDGTTETISPIMADIRNMNLIDGNNRYEAFKRAWAKGLTPELKLIFIPYGTEQMIDIQNQATWKDPNYIKFHIEHGDENVKKIWEFGRSHRLLRNGKGISVSYVGAILIGGRLLPHLRKDKCDIELTEEVMEKAEKLYNEVETIFDAIGYKQSAWFETMCLAWYAIRNNKENAMYSVIVDRMGVKRFCAISGAFLKQTPQERSTPQWIEYFQKYLLAADRADSFSAM